MKQVLQFIRRFLGRIVLLLNLGAIAWLFCCLAAAYIHPITIRYIALFTLTVPVAILVNVLFALAWLILSTRKIRSLLSVIALVLCYKLIAVVFGMNFFKENDMAAGNNRLKVMHWNAHGLGIFNIPQGKQDEKDMIAYLDEIDADILCLPEFPVPKKSMQTALAKIIMKNGGYKDYRFQADNTLGTGVFLGTAVFSRYPITNFKANKLSDYIYMIQGDVEIRKGDTIRMFLTHLSTFGLSDNDKDYIEEIGKTEDGLSANIDRSRSYMWKFNYAFVRRAREVEKAKAIMAQSPHPVIVCGDFNDLPGSYTYTQFNKDLSDAFLERGTGLGRTYNRLSPTLRIDYIFFNPKMLRCIGYQSPHTSLSDHNPVIANFEILNGL